ncbi:MAG: hypothetical protein DRI24_08985 [Deltaproteobacteria bacterium]|nr:MAG: hypothetical protein DRI24_08985 [Deltaproteobacteria bacterium]
MANIASGKVTNQWLSVLWVIGFAFIIQGCATTSDSLEVSNSLPPEKLAIYNDSFETIRDDKWDRAGMVFNKKQLKNFKLADMRIDNNQLVIETKTGAFSKGGLDTKYAIGGDFDIQLECHVRFLTGIYDMEQKVTFLVYDKSKTIKKSDYILIEVAKKGGKANGAIFSGGAKSGRFIPGNSRQLDGFHGSLRFVRQGNRISTFYKNINYQNWAKLNTFNSTTANLTFGFMLDNFYARREGSIDARKSIKATFDNFQINAAQNIQEEEI